MLNNNASSFTDFAREQPNWRAELGVYHKDSATYQRIPLIWQESQELKHEYHASINIHKGSLYLDCSRRKIFAKHIVLSLLRPLHTVVKTAWHATVIGPLALEVFHMMRLMTTYRQQLALIKTIIHQDNCAPEDLQNLQEALNQLEDLEENGRDPRPFAAYMQPTMRTHLLEILAAFKQGGLCPYTRYRNESMMLKIKELKSKVPALDTQLAAALDFSPGKVAWLKAAGLNTLNSLADIVRTPLYGLAMTITHLVGVVLGIFLPNTLYHTRTIAGNLEQALLRTHKVQRAVWGLTPCFSPINNVAAMYVKNHDMEQTKKGLEKLAKNVVRVRRETSTPFNDCGQLFPEGEVYLSAVERRRSSSKTE